MQYDVAVTPAQLKAAADWAAADMAEVLLAMQDDGHLLAGQGDEREVFDPVGTPMGDESGALPEPMGEPCTCEIGGYRQSPGNAGWTAHADDCPVRTSREGGEACPGTGRPRADCSCPECEDEREPTGDRIARLGRELIDPDYDPAAEDDDGVPLFSDETRAAAAADPRGERDR